MYRVILNDTVLENAPLGLDSFVVQVVREDGFENSSQILREKTETELTFYGDGYRLIANSMINSNCGVFDVAIEKLCNGSYSRMFDGKFKTSDVEVDINKCLIKTSIRDDSFTGLVKDYLGTELPLYYSKTKNCFPLERIDKSVVFGKRLFIFEIKKGLAFDVLDVLNYQIKYFTDNVSYVVSDFLSANKYIITTGYNIHNSNGSLLDKYPNISFNTLFLELRKKFRLYIVIEYDNLGTAYLRIEQENYSYSDNELLIINDLPNGITESIDITRLFNSINVGSDKTDLEAGSNRYNINTPLLNWQKTTYVSCGECSVSSDSEQSKLDLVSSFIIDSDIISELINLNEGVSSNNNTAIVLANYETISGEDILIRDNCNGISYIFNCQLINENVIQNWLDYSPQCVAISRYSTDYFNISLPFASSILQYPQIYRNDVVDFNNIISDNNLTITTNVTQSIYVNTIPFTGTITGVFSYYKCSKNGTYNLRAEIVNIRQDPAMPVFISVDYTLYIFIYSDDTFTTITNQYQVTVSAPNSLTDIRTLELETSLLALTVGQCAVVDYTIELIGAAPTVDYPFITDTINFFKKEDNSVCEDFDNGIQDAKARLISFKHPICYDDFLYLKANKRGYINLKGNKYWIKSVKYNDGKESEFELIGNNTIIQ